MVSDKDVKAHEGLVRCGNCYSVFNSSWNLTEDPRNDFIEEVSSIGKSVTPDGQGSGFTFSIMDNTTDTLAVTDDDVVHTEENDSEGSEALAHQESAAESLQDDLPPDIDLEPFPEPEMENFEDPLSVPERKNDNDSLLYFDANMEDADVEPADSLDNNQSRIEDLTILQTPSLTSEIPGFYKEDSSQKFDAEDEPEVASLSDESMWPGGDATPESDSEQDAPVVETVEGAAAEIDVSAEESPTTFSEEVPVDDVTAVSEPARENLTEIPHAVEIRVDSDPLLSPTIENEPEEEKSISADPAELRGEEDHWLDDVVAEATDIETMPALEVEDVSSIENDEKKDQGAVGDDTFYVAGETNDPDEFFSIDSLPKTADEAFSTEDKDNDADESVFITSEEEEIDDSYIPISLKSEEQNELFHGLDEFPEPGELSALNYEDTMEINAMLEEANISKEQIESALSAAEIADEDDRDEFAEENLLSSDAGNDLTDALFPTSGKKSRKAAEGVSQERKQSNSVLRYFKNIMPAALGQKKELKGQERVDDQTQLIMSLNRSNTQSVLPVWVGKYALTAGISLLVLIFLAQIGFFYMDRLVRITPLRPILEAGCKLAGCTVPGIQNIDEIEQLSSRLTPLSGGNRGFKVSSILVNRGIRSQSFPALELTLTDRAGNMISRRVVTPDIYLESDKRNVMKPNEAVDINIRFRTPSIRVDGFELRAVSQNWLERAQ